MRQLLTIVPMLALVALTSCAGDDDSEETDVEELTWQEMDGDQRAAYMASDVLPAMQAAFAGYDAERYETITCATCHGAGAGDGTWSMPSDDLFPIDFANFPTGAGADFMSNEVVPKMAELLNVEPFDPGTGEGFGCLGCHPAAE